MDSLAKWFAENLGTVLSAEAVVFIVSMLPILELRGGLIVAALLKVPMMKAIGICLVGNILPIPFILLFIRQIFKWLRPTKLLGPVVKKLETKAMGRSDRIQKYEFLGLVLFVGIPLPGTGAWTGSLIAALLGIDVKKSFLAVLIGICMATIIMLAFTYWIPALLH